MSSWFGLGSSTPSAASAPQAGMPSAAAGAGGYGAFQAQQMQAQQLFMAEQEIDMIADLHERVSDSCYKKCIPDTYYEGSLTKGESVCLDRCVAKFFETSIKIGKHMQQLAGNASPQ